MNTFAVTAADREFLQRFESGELEPGEFDHRAHVRLAYVHLAEAPLDQAVDALRRGLLAFLEQHGLPAMKFHETLTRAWLMAVLHFMNQSAGAESADAFIAMHPQLLDSKIMLTHYSAQLLFSEAARNEFIAPDVTDIPMGPGVRDDISPRGS